MIFESEFQYEETKDQIKATDAIKDYIAKKMDETEVIYYNTLDGMLEFIEKTIKND